ncbi:hypothetical protein PC120_g4443 [Phytophthora cactorum]|nr:hypothetical protein PC120_g4443 [Phytophthora cactorum]
MPFSTLSQRPLCTGVVTLLEDTHVLNSVTIKLQDEDVTLADVRVLSDSVMQRYPSMKPKLSSTATTVHSPTFESAVVKVINVELLSANERKAVRRFEITIATSAAGTKRAVLATSSSV